MPKSRLDGEIGKRLELAQQLLDNLPSFGATGMQLSLPGTRDPLARHRDAYKSWDEYNEQLLRTRFSTGKVADHYHRVTDGIGGRGTPHQELEWLTQDITSQMRKLESIRNQLDLYEPQPDPGETGTPAFSDDASRGKKIFIVHGQNEGVKHKVAGFLQALTGERPVILHEQPGQGSRTIIEKFEAHASETSFAVVLLTADDEGNAKGETPLNPRARQNVILELGYFLGKLGRDHVVALYEEGVELPSDLHGVQYVPFNGNWRIDLAKELRAAHIDIDPEAVLSAP